MLRPLLRIYIFIHWITLLGCNAQHITTKPAQTNQIAMRMVLNDIIQHTGADLGVVSWLAWDSSTLDFPREYYNYFCEGAFRHKDSLKIIIPNNIQHLLDTTFASNIQTNYIINNDEKQTRCTMQLNVHISYQYQDSLPQNYLIECAQYDINYLVINQLEFKNNYLTIHFAQLTTNRTGKFIYQFINKKYRLQEYYIGQY